MTTAQVTTDLSDYAPGTTAQINAQGFDPNSTIQFSIQIMNADGTLSSAVNWLGSGDADGHVATAFYVQQMYANTTILLTATEVNVASDGTVTPTGPVATEVFTDSVSVFAVTLTKTVSSITDTNGNGLTDAGDVIHYNIVATNTGLLPLTGVTITDPLTGGVLSSGVTLAAGASETINTSYTVTQANVDANATITNTATVTDNQTQPVSASATTPVTYAPAVGLTKTVTSITDTNGDGLVDAGDVIHYQVVATNTGDVTLTGVTIVDPLAGGTLASGVTLGVGASDTVTASYTLTQSDVDTSATVTNTATVSDDQTGSVNAQVSTPVDYKPSVAITKTVTSITDTNGDGLVDAGDVINYKVVATNTGDVTLTGVTITDPVTGGALVSNVVLGVGASDTVNTSYTLTQADVDAKADFVNTATVSDNQTDSASATATTPVGYAPGVSILKTVTSITDTNHDNLVDAGDVINYKVVATNTGDVTLTGVAITDPVTGGPLASNVTLNVGASDTVTTSYTLTQADVDAKANFANTATVSDDQTGPSSSTVTTPVDYAPGVSILKTVTSVTDTNGNGRTDAGDVINYSVTATNTGDVTLTNVAITDPVSGGSLASGVTLGVGASDTVTTSHTLTQADVDAKANFVNTATVSDDQTGPASSTVSTPVDYAPGVSLTKVVTSITDTNHDNLVDAGDVINYKIVATNTGDVTLTNVAITDPLSGGTLASGVTLGVGANDTVTTSYTLTQANVDANTAIVNTATVTDDQTGPVSASATTVVSNAPGVSLTKVVTSITDTNHDNLVDAGDVINYKIVATNTGNVTLTDVAITDPVAGGSLASNVTLAVGASDTVTTSYTITQTDVNAHTAIVNTATVTDDQTGPVSAQATTTPSYAPGVTLTKVVTSITDTNHDGVTDAGDVINYKIVATNTGDVTLTGLAITDPLAGGTLASNVTLAVGASDTVNTSYTLTQANVNAGSNFVNTATVTDNQTGPVSASATTPVSNVPASVSLTKTVTSITDTNCDGLVDAGDVIHYKIVATNTGTTTLTGVKIVDPLSGGTLASGVTLAAHASDTVTTSHTLTQADIDAHAPFVNTATVTDNQTAAVSASATTIVSYAPGLKLTKTVTSISQSCTVTQNNNNSCTIVDKSGNRCTINNYNSNGCNVTYNGNNCWTVTDRNNNSCTVSNNGNGWTTNSSNGNCWSVSRDHDDSCSNDCNNNTSSNGNGLTDAGDIVNYKIVATNTGDVTLTGVTITDPLTGGTLASNVTIAVGATYTVNTSYTITQANVDAHTALINTATATDNQTAAVNASASTVLSYAPSASLSKAVTSITDSNHDGMVDAGDVINYKITATNTGDVTLTGGKIVDPLSGGTLASNLTIAVGASTSVNTSHTLTQANIDAHTSFVNTATFSDNQTASVSASASTSVSYAPCVTVTKTVTSITDANHNGLVDAGDTINYKIVATNSGDVSLTGVKIVDAQAGGTLASNVNLAVGASDTVTTSYKLTQSNVSCGSPFVNTATASSSQGASDSDSVGTLVQTSVCYNYQASNTAHLVVAGTTGADTIIAGTGGDTITGKGGADNFILNAVGKDVIKDTAANLNGTTVVNFSSLDSIDLTNVAYGSHTTIGFTNASNGAIMTVTDGSHTAAIQLLGQFAAASFHTGSDGAGGTIVSYTQPAQPPLLAGAH